MVTLKNKNNSPVDTAEKKANQKSSVEELYKTRLKEREEQLSLALSKDLLIARLRLTTFLLGVFAAAAGPLWNLYSWLWGLVFLPPFVFLVLLHRKTLKEKGRAEQSVDFYRKGLERLGDNWGGKGSQREKDARKDHPYAVDIDLFGPHSLFERLCTARTDGGEAALSRWLTEPAPTDEILKRQNAVDTLRNEVNFREEIHVTSEGVKAEFNSEILQTWLFRSTHFPHRWTWIFRTGGVFMTLCLASTAFLWRFTDMGPLPFAAAVCLQLVYIHLLKRKVFAKTAGLDRPERQLRILTLLLEKFESANYADPMLESLQKRLCSDKEQASSAVNRLSRLVTWIESRNNMFFGPIWFALSLTIHTSIAVEKWRLIHGPRVMDWTAAVGEWEALLSLSTYAYENPSYPFPDIRDSDRPVFQGVELGHPLLPEKICVRNNVLLDEETPVWIVSGSNMSGKSTLLRAVGLNVVLAMAGGPVRAQSITLTPLQVGATIRIEDSLQAGSSRFYEEIKRLKQLMDLTTAKYPLLFLLDEILHGTNSHDRCQGAKAIIAEFIRKGSIGLVTTHDLGVAAAAENNLLKNVHFTDQVMDGKLVFDYKLKSGVVEKSNALELMRNVGLEV